ncbi:MAG: zinc ribbon domain-containing protein [Dehalococcoidales bacterium]|nr:zinc ribbon domain-containing protein [Dehalococcoidales bacterium]MDP7415593.1 zinc ribbon domain-containing protein [Dehalococcoidales bacterium]
MPVYEYECGHCQTHFDCKQSFDEEPVTMCPECRGKARRVISSIPVIFKGSGFYITDSRKKVKPEKSESKEKPVGEKKDKEVK